MLSATDNAGHPPRRAARRDRRAAASSASRTTPPADEQARPARAARQDVPGPRPRARSRPTVAAGRPRGVLVVRTIDARRQRASTAARTRSTSSRRRTAARSTAPARPRPATLTARFRRPAATGADRRATASACAIRGRLRQRAGPADRAAPSSQLRHHERAPRRPPRHAQAVPHRGRRHVSRSRTRARASRGSTVGWKSHRQRRALRRDRDGSTLRTRAAASLRASTRRPRVGSRLALRGRLRVPARGVTRDPPGPPLGGGRYRTFADTTTGAARPLRGRLPLPRRRLARPRVPLPREAQRRRGATRSRPGTRAASPCASADARAGRLPLGDRRRPRRGTHVPTYFVTGATGFIGRHLVERLLAREGEIHVLVRPGSEEKLEAIVERLGGGDRIHAGRAATCPSRYLGVDAATRDALRGNVDHFFHLAAIYDMTADETQNALLNVGGTQNAIDLANDLQAGIFHHASSIAVAGEYEGHFTEDMFDEGQKLPIAVPPDEVRVREARPHPRPGRLARLPARRSSSATRAPARWTRSTGPYYFFKAIQKARHALPEWFPLDRARGRLDQHRPGRLRRRRDGPHRAPAGPRRPGVPPRQPAPAARRRRAQHVRARRPRAADGDPDRQADDRHAAEGRAVVRDEAAGAEGHPRARCSPTSGSPTR